MSYQAFRRLVRGSSAGVCGAVLLLAAASAAHASTTLVDNYDGGDDFYSGNSSFPATAVGTVDGQTIYEADVISDVNDQSFDISQAVISRSNGGNTLNITIDTNYAGNAGVDGTGYGSLFLTPGVNAWNPSGTAANNYATDVYQPGEWAYAFSVPTDPSTSSGTGGLYSVDNSDVVLSNVAGDATSYPLAGNNGWYFRQGEAVQYDTAGQTALDTGTWTVGVGTLTFSINDNGLLGDNFAMSWAMTCANDIIQGQVSGVPEPATWAMMLLGFGLVGFAKRSNRLSAKA